MALCPGLPRWASTRKVKQIWILLEQEKVSGSGTRWAICKSASRTRQATTPAPHCSVFYRPDAFLRTTYSVKANIPKSLKSVNFWQSYSKNRKLDVMGTQRTCRCIATTSIFYTSHAWCSETLEKKSQISLPYHPYSIQGQISPEYLVKKIKMMAVTGSRNAEVSRLVLRSKFWTLSQTWPRRYGFSLSFGFEHFSVGLMYLPSFNITDKW